MSALDPFISNPATSILPGEVAGASAGSAQTPVSVEAAFAQLFILADCSGSNLARANLAAGAGPEPLLLPAPAAFFPDICELLAYANGGLFYPVSPRDETDSLPSESDPSVTLDFPRGESIASPPLFLSNPSFEFTQSVRERGGVT